MRPAAGPSGALVATRAAGDAFGSLRSNAGDSVRLIRAYAESTAKPSIVYNLAQIPLPATPTPMPLPGQPTNFTVTLTPADGALSLRWKCTNPPGAAGTSYIVRRRLPGESEWTFIGVSGKKEFVDDTLFAGPDSVQYTVRGQRANSSGPLSKAFTVNFGQNAGGGMMVSAGGAHGLETRATQDVLETRATDNGLETRATDNGLETRATQVGLETRSTASTVNGRTVQKVLPSGNGSGKRGKARV